jgi:hypothetical protein
MFLSLFGENKMMKNGRYSSTLTKLWVKQNASQATQVSIAADCINVSDLLKAIKKA